MEDKRVTKTLALLERTFFELKFEKKRKKITVTDICTYANINRGTFYRYYYDVIDMEQQIELKCVNNVMDALLQNYKFDGEYSNFLDTLLPYLESNPYEAKMVLGKEASSTAYHAFCDALSHAAMPKWLSHGNISPEKAEILLNYVAAGVYSLLGSWVSQNVPIDEESFKALYYSIGKGNIMDVVYQS